MYATPSPSEPPVHTIGLLVPETGLLPADGTLYSRYEVGLPPGAVKATLTVRLLLLPMVATTLVGCPGTTAADASKQARLRRATDELVSRHGAASSSSSSGSGAGAKGRRTVYASEPQRQRAPREPQRMHRTRPSLLTVAPSRAHAAHNEGRAPPCPAFFALRPNPSGRAAAVPHVPKLKLRLAKTPPTLQPVRCRDALQPPPAAARASEPASRQSARISPRSSSSSIGGPPRAARASVRLACL